MDFPLPPVGEGLFEVELVRWLVRPGDAVSRGQGLAETLAADHPGRVTWDLLPSLEDEPWFDAARRMRVSLDYVRVLDRQYPDKLRVRAEERTARVVRWASALPLAGAPLTLAALKRFERLMPASDAMVEYLRAQGFGNAAA